MRREKFETLPSIRPVSRAAMRENPRSVKMMLSARSSYYRELQSAMIAAVQCTKHILTAANILNNMCYPLKQGNVVVKLLDQAIYELREIGERQVNLNPQKFFNTVFEMDDECDQYAESYEELSGQIMESTRFEPWQLHHTIGILLDCKRQVMLQQICLLVGRVQLDLFEVYFKSKKVIELAPIQICLQSNSHGLVSSVKYMYPQKYKRISTRKESQVQSNLYATLKNIISKKLVRPEPDSKFVGEDGSYRMLFNPVSKYYQRILAKDYQDEEIRYSCDFVDRLNGRLKQLASDRYDTALGASLKENSWLVTLVAISIFLGLLFSLAIEDNLNQLTLQLLVFAIIAFGCIRMLNSAVYSHRLFRDDIRYELRRHHYRNDSKLLYYIYPGGYDILIIYKPSNSAN